MIDLVFYEESAGKKYIHVMQSPKKIQHGIKSITRRQLNALGEFARNHKGGIPRENFDRFLNDKAQRNRFLDSLMGDTAWIETLKAEAEKVGARIHILNLAVDWDRSHNEAAMAGGPQTKASHNVLKVDGSYLSVRCGKIAETFVLVNWLQDGQSYSEAVEWGLTQGLQKTLPRESFAVGEQCPNLNYELEEDPMCVVETTGCSFDGLPQACYVSWNDAKRTSDLLWQDNFGFSDVWFLFRKFL